MAMIRLRTLLLAVAGTALLTAAGYRVVTYTNLNPGQEVGAVVDEFNGVKVYYNGGVNNSEGRNLSRDGYNLGIKYQCVEFVKRYYFERFNHRMPDAFGNAKDFFDAATPQGALNAKRGLVQYRNGEAEKPQVDDLVIFPPTLFNPYGHVAIVANVTEREVEIVQQNPGPFSSSRARLALEAVDGRWTVAGSALGWLRPVAALSSAAISP
ncbi:CHAP domain-containing protein [Variovorax sp. ZS18.2.2]|uniref:CHAP domain-containing protein n=1 Tax=Variovorax sp. ZS18.2.2 TaxID=2971255 RepID=UPI0021516038|nr:CHAP domain-containing protein [Variovorax sp. ZS18.2.2]MCR6479939.1 CHAP domain-containing protein [Variovorax sp. ZS18.2.2]